MQQQTIACALDLVMCPKQQACLQEENPARVAAAAGKRCSDVYMGAHLSL